MGQFNIDDGAYHEIEQGIGQEPNPEHWIGPELCRNRQFAAILLEIHDGEVLQPHGGKCEIGSKGQTGDLREKHLIHGLLLPVKVEHSVATHDTNSISKNGVLGEEKEDGDCVTR